MRWWPMPFERTFTHRRDTCITRTSLGTLVENKTGQIELEMLICVCQLKKCFLYFSAGWIEGEVMMKKTYLMLTLQIRLSLLHYVFPLMCLLLCQGISSDFSKGFFFGNWLIDWLSGAVTQLTLLPPNFHHLLVKVPCWLVWWQLACGKIFIRKNFGAILSNQQHQVYLLLETMIQSFTEVECLSSYDTYSICYVEMHELSEMILQVLKTSWKALPYMLYRNPMLT